MEQRIKWMLKEFFNAQKGLGQLGVIRSRDYIGDIGRYLCQVTYDLELAEPPAAYDGRLGDARVLVRFNNCPQSAPVRVADDAEFDELLVVLGPNSWLRPQGIQAEFVFYRLTRQEVLDKFQAADGQRVGRQDVFAQGFDKLLGLIAEPDTPLGPQAEVSLREVTDETVRDVCRLSDSLTPPKKYMVAPNAISIAQAYFSEQAWFRAVYADDTPVGFIMLYDDPEEQDYFLWRFMIAEHHHGKGYGRRALELLIEYVKTRPGAIELHTSCGQGEGSPEGFYRRMGFERTGKIVSHEVVMRLALE